MDNYFDASARTHRSSVANPNNAVAKLSDYGTAADLRPEFKLTSDRTRWILRPRWVIRAVQWTEGATNQSNTYSDGDFDITDAYVDVRLLDPVHVTLGLEVYQWGPAELSNISNPLYHLNTLSRSSFYKEKGQVLARLSFDFTDQWSHMLIVNPISNNEPPFMSEQEFRPSAFLKSEVRSKAGQSYFGLLAGTQADGRKFFGEYMNTTTDSGWSFYLDARHPIGERRFQSKDQGAYKANTLVSDDVGVKGLAVTGVRYEGRVDTRLEYFYNYDGFTRDDFRAQINSLRTLSPYYVSNLTRFLRPGLELYGQHYAYFSVRVPDLGRKKDSSFSFRTLSSIQDGSTLAQSSYEKPFSDSVVGLLEGFVTLGEENQELTLFDRTAVVVGAKWTL